MQASSLRNAGVYKPFKLATPAVLRDALTNQTAVARSWDILAKPSSSQYFAVPELLSCSPGTK